jgi:hypothetical protein
MDPHTSASNALSISRVQQKRYGAFYSIGIELSLESPVQHMWYRFLQKFRTEAPSGRLVRDWAPQFPPAEPELMFIVAIMNLPPYLNTTVLRG